MVNSIISCMATMSDKQLQAAPMYGKQVLVCTYSYSHYHLCTPTALDDDISSHVQLTRATKCFIDISSYLQYSI